MLKRKKLAQAQRKRKSERNFVMNLEVQRERGRELHERRVRLKEYRESCKNVFWQKYHDSLRQDQRVGRGNSQLVATPCTKPRSVIDPY